jgi:predicted cupin superfamily sugar epimerase
MPSAADIIERLKLERHPEGGWYIQTFQDGGTAARAHSTAIYYLLEKGDRSHWHKVDAVEVWHYYAGAPLELGLSRDGDECRSVILGADLFAGQSPQIVVERHEWQSARSLGDWTLVGCTVAPGFEFSGFEMAAPGWMPKAAMASEK